MVDLSQPAAAVRHDDVMQHLIEEPIKGLAHHRLADPAPDVGQQQDAKCRQAKNNGNDPETELDEYRGKGS